MIYSVLSMLQTPGGEQSGERINPTVGYTGAVTEKLAAAVDGGAL